MKKISVKQYKDAIQNAGLSDKQLRVLRLLYNSPDSSATALELAYKIDPDLPVSIKASGAIGRTGKKIGQYLNVNPGTYPDKGIMRTAHYYVIGDYYRDIGWVMWENLRKALIELKEVSEENDPDSETLPTEIPENRANTYWEGAVTQAFVNRYERNRKARNKCIDYYGTVCKACEFDFEESYGKIGTGFIHVHHEIELSAIRKGYVIDPIKDLKPVCPNCHSMLHKKSPAYSIAELQNILKAVKQSKK